MQFLTDGFRHSAWATGALLNAYIQAGLKKVAEASEGMYQPVEETLRHAVTVEHNYLCLLGAEGPEAHPKALDAPGLLSLQEAVGEAYVRFLHGAGAAALDRRVHISWFKADVSAGDALLQVLIHSAEHRADVAFALNRRGVKTPHMDYVVWALKVRDGRPES